MVSKPLRNVQTGLFPSAGASIFVLDGKQLVPTDKSTGDLSILVDHA